MKKININIFQFRDIFHPSVKMSVDGQLILYTRLNLLSTHDDNQKLKLLRTICRNIVFLFCKRIINFAGILCVVLGAVILVLDLRYPEAVTSFFGVDPLQAETFIEGKRQILIIWKESFEESNLQFTFTSDSVWLSLTIFNIRLKS